MAAPAQLNKTIDPVISSIQIFRRTLIQLLAIILPLGVASKFYTGPAHYWVVAHAGGVLYVVFWILLALLMRPQISVRVVAATVLGITCLLEVLQLWQPAGLIAVRNSFIGHALIGSSFAWWDFPHYALGSILGLVLALAAHKRASGNPRSE